MANWIKTTIEITGNKEVLQKIYDAVSECLDMPEYLDNGSENWWVGNVFDKLGINTKKYADRAFWHEPRFNKKGHLLITELSAWEKSKCAEALRTRFYYEISGINYITE